MQQPYYAWAACQISWPSLVFARARVRVMAVKLRGNFKTSPLLPQGERLCSSFAKTLCALMIPLATQAADWEETKTVACDNLIICFYFYVRDRGI